ncbi:MAG: FAD-dependent oxidoreductase [bacterium]|nr:FAD-dependent oxidoreductase [bacterium]
MKIIITGCGFSGINALKVLGRFSECQITVIDKRKDFIFLPLLPDVISSRIRKESVTYPINKIADKYKAVFINQAVKNINAASNQVILADNSALSYDYLLVCAGSETNFYKYENIKDSLIKLDDINDTKIIYEAVTNKAINNYLIAGGGYTSIELVSAMKKLLTVEKLDKSLYLVVRGNTILRGMPEWIQKYTIENLVKQGINIIYNTRLESFNNNKSILTSGSVYNESAVIWAAGVKCPDLIQADFLKKDIQNRVYTDKDLSVSDNIFIAGDCSKYIYKSAALRMGVSFSIRQGQTAARNIINRYKNKKTVAFVPFDFGYIIPASNEKSCGMVFVIKIKGKLATCLHYFTAVFFSYASNKIKVFLDLTSVMDKPASKRQGKLKTGEQNIYVSEITASVNKNNPDRGEMFAYNITIKFDPTYLGDMDIDLEHIRFQLGQSLEVLSLSTNREFTIIDTKNQAKLQIKAILKTNNQGSYIIGPIKIIAQEAVLETLAIEIIVK